jgi:hypothetical protein
MQINTNINSYREVYMNEMRSPQHLPSAEFGIPNIGNFPASVTNAQGLGSGLIVPGNQVKRNIQLGNVKMQQFPPVAGVVASQVIN